MKSPQLSELLEQYVQYCSVIRNYADTTLTNYRNNIGWFLEESGLEYPEDLNKRDIEAWFFKGRVERKWAASTFRHYFKYLNTFLKWLKKEGYIDKNFMDDIEKPKLEKRIPRTLTREEALLVLDAAYHISYAYRFERYRNRAIVGVMVLAGLRRKEMLSLRLNDISIKNRTIFINQGKGGKDRMVPMNNKLALILSEYLEDRKRVGRECIYLFTAVQRDQQLGHKGISRMVARLRLATKVDFSAHTLRHAFARLMLEGGCDIYTLSKIMGHSKITTTTIYLTCSNKQMSKGIEMHSLN